ncbi:kunitz-type serine protease inhibitor HCRG1 [Scaptodrosophila lebanonensis]|uniref:Kunitz-type serine protease inhibitor HCRG1 n=1 Tax=Drosophila lebanonensis TaxID=7225 RepID=A0A6J2U7W1_DROLE|nr:kunitz-type serine protease inhibitor HCRG1 [Scaptodrosophila lebanonensis]
MRLLRWEHLWLLPLLLLHATCVLGLRLNSKAAAVLENQTQQVIACSQPKAPGLCRGRQLRYAYNKDTGNCESFYYTGCASTKNNFLTFEECRRDCMQRLRY